MATSFVQMPKKLLALLYARPVGPLRSKAVILWWEARRIPYNVIVGAVGMVSSAVMVTVAFTCNSRGGAPIGLPDPPVLAIMGVLMYGIAANICYTGGWITELVVARFWRVDTAPFGPIAFALGTAFSVLVTLIPAGLVIAAAAMTSCGAQGLCSTELKAIRAASDLLSRHRSASDYEAAKAHVQNSAAKWYVWVPRVTAPGVVMPAEALIEVNKVNCASRWVPQR